MNSDSEAPLCRHNDILVILSMIVIFALH